MANIVCAGAGPHNPASGILGTSDKAQTAPVYCSKCTPPVDPTVTNRADMETKLTNALATNITFSAIASPTTAQVTAQVKQLTKEASALIHLALGKFDDTSGT